MISVHELEEDRFRVDVEGSAPTSHEVIVSDEYHQRLTAGHISKVQLVERSFQFLLEREPNTSILPRFDLPVIGHYFPDYERVMRATMN